MEKHTVNESRPSTLVWASLEERFRQQVQSMLQELLEEEVTEFLGRVKSERRPAGATSSAGLEGAVPSAGGLPNQFVLEGRRLVARWADPAQGGSSAP